MPQLAIENPRFDRRELLGEAQRARARGRLQRAVALYEYALSLEPDDLEVAARLAPLLAQCGRSFEAWRQFRLVGKALVNHERYEWALSIFREGAHCLPHEFDAWRITASLERKLGRPQLALDTLWEGRNHFRSALDRDQAIALLECAREIEPWDVHVVLDLSQLIARSGQLTRAMDLLEQLVLHSDDEELARIRAAQLRITWSPTHALQWLRCVLPGLGSPSAPRSRLKTGALLKTALARRH